MIQINLIKGDCLEKMGEIPDSSVDLVLVDPPYGTTPCEWDKALDLEKTWVALKRLVKPAGVIIMFGTEPFSSRLRLSNLEMYKYDWIWKKTKDLGANFAHAKNAPIKVVENILVFSGAKVKHIGQSDRMTYIPQGLIPYGKTIKDRLPSKIDSFRKEVERPPHKAFVQEFTNYPSNVLELTFESSERRNRLHPTQKPVALLGYLIETYSKPGDTVLDFTMGSGSTGVACKNLGRSFIGIEKDEAFYKVAENRLTSR